MTQLKAPESSFKEVPQRRRRRRRGRRGRTKRPATAGSRIVLAVGTALIVAGVAVLGWVVWQFWGTSWQSQQKHQTVTSELREGWTTGEAEVRTDWGEATALLRVPRFGEDYLVPVLEGSSDAVLAAGVGHMEETAGPGERGNYVLAGHRVTHGEPFADLLELQPGDLVYVETRDTIYTYVIDTGGNDLRLPFTSTWVLDAWPVNPNGGTEPIDAGTDRLITLLTCSEIFNTDDRSIVFGHLVERASKFA
jgi:sortase A